MKSSLTCQSLENTPGLNNKWVVPRLVCSLSTLINGRTTLALCSSSRQGLECTALLPTLLERTAHPLQVHVVARVVPAPLKVFVTFSCTVATLLCTEMP